MIQQAIEQLTEALAQEVATKAAPKLIELIGANRPDPLLSVREASKEINLCETTVRSLVNAGLIKRAPGLADIRIRRSVLAEYGKSNPNPKKK